MRYSDLGVVSVLVSVAACGDASRQYREVTAGNGGNTSSAGAPAAGAEPGGNQTAGQSSSGGLGVTAGSAGRSGGGATSTGGVPGGGGATSTGGVPGGGGSATTGGSATGGNTTTGGSTTAGGSTTTGGSTTAGGSATTGGVATTTGGVATTTGGVATTTGGVATTTGGVATGGVATGGVATGGVATGGVATGGASCTLIATQSIVDTAAGTLTMTDPGGKTTTCAPTCSFSTSCGTPFTLTATPKAGSGLASWNDPTSYCTGSNPSCVAKAINPTNTIIATFSPYNLAFVTSGAYSPNVGGTAVADRTCQTLAGNAGLPGASSFVAFLSTDGVNAIDRLPANAQGWLRTDFLPFAASRANIQNGTLWYPLVLTETATLAPLGTDVYTGSRTDATANPGYNCNAWTNATASYNLQTGALGGGPGNWLTWGTGNCTQVTAGRLYCFGTKYSIPLGPPPPVAGRRVFLSVSTLNPSAGSGSGIAGADTLCRNDATTAGLCSGTTCAFKAVLAQTTLSAKAHFTNQDGTTPVVRLDNVRVADSATNFWLGNLIAPIALHSNGRPSTQGERLYTGATSPSVLGTAASTCGDWSVTAAAGAIYGMPMMGPNWFNWTNLFGCTAALSVYCLEDVP
jgi:hypothetical protein